MRVLKRYALVISLFVGMAGTILLTTSKKESMFDIQQGIAKEVIRFHVLANSDEQYDQELKLKVKDQVVSYLEKSMGEPKDVKEARKWMEEHLVEVSAVAENVIHKEGYSYPVTTSLTKAYFPVKQYGDCTLPNGVYQALQIKIGEAKGKNWWCVLFPNLCFTDLTTKEVTKENKDDLKRVLTKDEFDIVTNKKKVRIRFKLAELLSEKSHSEKSHKVETTINS